MEKGEKAADHTHVLVAKTPLLPPAALVCERSDIHTTVGAAVVSAHNFSWQSSEETSPSSERAHRVLCLELPLIGCCKEQQSHFFLLASSTPQSPNSVQPSMKCYKGFSWHLLPVTVPQSSWAPRMGLASIPEPNQSLHDLVKAQWHLLGASVIKQSNICWLLFYGIIKLEMPDHYVSIIFSIASLFLRYSNCQTSKLFVAEPILKFYGIQIRHSSILANN